MNNVFVYCELEGTTIADVSLELLTKGRKLANQLNCQLEAIVAGSGLEGIEKQVMPYGVDKVHIFDAPGLFPYTSLPHSSVLINLFKEEKPQICLMGATVIGRDFVFLLFLFPASASGGRDVTVRSRPGSRSLRRA